MKRSERVEHLGVLLDPQRLVLTDVLSETPCSVRVTAMQARLLAGLLRRPRDVLTGVQLRAAIGRPGRGRSDAVKAHLHRVTRLIHEGGGAAWTQRLKFWRSVRGAGYCVSDEWAAARLTESARLLTRNLSAGALRARARHLDDPHAAMLLGHLGATASKHGRVEQAAAYHREALDLRTRMGDLAGLPRTSGAATVVPAGPAGGAFIEHGPASFEDAAGGRPANVRAL